MHPSAFVLGYHGCDREVGERILGGEHDIQISENQYDWLGSGAYFWESDPDRALYWAGLIKSRPQHFRQKIQRPFVIGAVVDLVECLDLTEAANLKLLRDAYIDMEKTFKETGIALPVNGPGFVGDIDLAKRNLDCAVINYLHSFREENRQLPFETVRAAFSEGTPLYKGSKIMERTHVQICVRNPNESIKGYFRLRD